MRPEQKAPDNRAATALRVAVGAASMRPEQKAPDNEAALADRVPEDVASMRPEQKAPDNAGGRFQFPAIVFRLQ